MSFPGASGRSENGAQDTSTMASSTREKAYATQDQKRLLAAHGIEHVPGRSKEEAETLLLGLASSGKIPEEDARSPIRTRPARAEQLERLCELGEKPTPELTRSQAGERIVWLQGVAPARKEDFEYLRGLGITPPPSMTIAEFHDLLIEVQAKNYATQAQIDFIKRLGGTVPTGLTKEGASDILGRLTAKAPMSEGQRTVVRINGGIIDCHLSYKEASEFIDYLREEAESGEEVMASKWSGRGPCGLGCLTVVIALVLVLLLLKEW